jgi:hypothetical protein
VADNTACDDGVACTQSDTCQSGTCQAGTQVRCRVTGGGQLTTGGPWVSFGFNAQTGQGQFEYNRHTAPKAAYHSVELTLVSITNVASCTGGQTATLEGTLRKKGQPSCAQQACCEFQVIVEDCGEPGSGESGPRDTFNFSPTGGDCPEPRDGPLDKGNIQIH